MAGKRAKNAIGVNVGTSSLLLVFVILCLVSFATLSMVSANADSKLTAKIMEKNSDYYDACNQAEEKLNGIDLTLASLYYSSESREDYYAQAGEKIDFIIPVNDVSTLCVSVSVNYPQNAGDHLYTISKWQLETTGSLEIEKEDSLNLLF